MPIYAYRCTRCGHAQDVLQKVSDPVLTVCPACGEASYAKQVTAAGFQLKGSGWYVTDFRGGSGAAAPKEPNEAKAGADGDGKPSGAGQPAAPAAAAQASDSKSGAPAADAKAAAPAAASPSPTP